MMKSPMVVLTLGLTAGLAGLVYAAGDHEAEFKNCAVCKSMAKPGLMDHMTFETHKIDNGMLCVATVDKDHVKEFETAHKELMANAAKAEADQKAGKEVKLCGFCQGVSELMKAGVKHQEVPTARGAVTLFTSDNPSVVSQIHQHADQAIAMQKEMAAKHGAELK